MPKCYIKQNFQNHVLFLVEERKCVTPHKCKLIVNAVSVREALYDLVTFLRFKKREKHGRSYS